MSAEPQKEVSPEFELNYEIKYYSALINQIQKSNPPDKEEKIGDNLYAFILKTVELLKLNTLKKEEISNDAIAGKLTGILLQSDALVDILSDLSTFTTTLNDLIVKVYS